MVELLILTQMASEPEELSLLEMNNIRDTLEKMSKFNQVEVLRILSSHKEVTLNENKYGIHVNLTDLSLDTINELKKFISYVNAQESTLHQIEQQKENFKNIYFTKDNKEIQGKLNS